MGHNDLSADRHGFRGIISRYKVGLMAVAIYMLLIGLALVYFLKHRAEDALAGLFLTFLTTPWSIVAALLLFLIDIGNQVTGTIKIVLIMLFSAINAVIIFFLSMRLSNRAK